MKAGDWVVCIDGTFPFKEGQPYRIVHADASFVDFDDPSLEPNSQRGWFTFRFKVVIPELDLYDETTEIAEIRDRFNRGELNAGS